MTSDVVSQWNARVAEIEAETECVLEEISGVQRMEAELRFEIKKYQDAVKKERHQLERKITAAEKRTETTQMRLETATQAQQKAEELWKKTLDEYESLSALVSQVKKQELRLNNREDYYALMNAETSSWGQEEAQLHRRIHELRDLTRRTARENADELTQLRKTLKEAELRLHSDRMGRDAEQGRLRGMSQGRGQSHSQSQSRAMSAASSSTSHGGSAAPLRGHSKATGPSRKRDIMGDMTNNFDA